MEVHAHTHTSRKKWTHYFWEFLMLFLAVFCGFMAEYQLEHKIEKDRERQFISSLADDLKDDIATTDQYIERAKISVSLFDSLCHYLDSAALAKENGDIIYYAARMGPRTSPFTNNSRTFDQLTNSGGFRLIHKTETSNNIMAYYSQLPWIRLLEANYNREFDAYKQAAGKVIDPGIYRRQENGDGSISRSTDNPALLSYDPLLLKEMEFHAVQMNGSRRSLIPRVDTLKRSAQRLLGYLQKTYGLKQ
jgi:hypothetical protein